MARGMHPHLSTSLSPTPFSCLSSAATHADVRSRSQPSSALSLFTRWTRLAPISRAVVPRRAVTSTLPPLPPRSSGFCSTSSHTPPYQTSSTTSRNLLFATRHVSIAWRSATLSPPLVSPPKASMTCESRPASVYPLERRTHEVDPKLQRTLALSYTILASLVLPTPSGPTMATTSHAAGLAVCVSRSTSRRASSSILVPTMPGSAGWWRRSNVRVWSVGSAAYAAWSCSRRCFLMMACRFSFTRLRSAAISLWGSASSQQEDSSHGRACTP
ncbi:uncharacterized protein LOC123430856 [Hordeum vulgare subsp. vulgare]|uniref:uncharacterized protein LOC123430856 n=1 Tax=Hordeum vulgare subsp. vulgare TaxID=112509 RepID=UPI001D1A499C|nr:uncharacterized protein LOC123430856 [Hordeum vulgare subsp. vulgare]